MPTIDSLSRLVTSTNPESGSITYKYDTDTNCASPNSFVGLLVSKTDARGIRTCAQYDAINRVTQKNYSDGTLSAFFAYDGPGNGFGVPVTNVVGRLSEQWTGTSCCVSGGGEIFGYDAMGRILVNEQYAPGMGFREVQYTYDLVGDNTSITYPSGRVVNYTFDSAGRPAMATDSSNGITYAAAQSAPPSGCLSSGVCYTPQGSEYSSAIGKTSAFAGVNLSETYNVRLQPLEIKASSSAGSALDITYGYADPLNGNANAGHVFSITNNLNSSRSQAFTYDALNRVTSAGTSATSGAYCWGYQYSLDAWANLLSQAGWSPNYNGCSEATMGAVAANGNNQISGFTYDGSGNTVNDGSITYTYNAESEMASAAGVTYTYDAQGRRVTKSSGKNYVYSVGGQILVETDGSGNTLNEYVFFAGKRVAMLPAGGSAQYYVEDMLGTSRIVTTNTGTVCYDADFDPFGGEHAYTNTCSQNYKFEGKERDTETGNDDFGARYYTSRFGRWLSADWSSVPVPVPYANLTNPQTLNLYAMVSDDPESFADLDGHATTQMYQLANPAASSAWDPMGAGSMFDESGLTQEEFNALDAVAATEAAQSQAQGQSSVAQDVKDTVAGALSAWAHDNGASGPVQGNELGQAIGDIGALVQGMYEIVQGGALALGGSAEALTTAPAAATGVGTVIPGVGAVVAAAGVLEAAHGAAVFGNTLSNIHMASEHKEGARESTRGKHEEGQARKRRDQGGEKADAKRRQHGMGWGKRPYKWKGPWPPKD